ncbi:MAG: S41 family peptidase [bacterium]
MRKRILIVLVMTAMFCGTAFSAKKDSYEALKPLMEVYSLIQDSYVDEEKTDPKKLIEGAMKGMVGTLDPFSQYMDVQSYKDMGDDTKAQFGGLGIEISVKDGQLVVVAPFEDTPAYKAGIKAGDKIMKIESDSTDGIEIMDAVHKLRGTPGTSVTITIQRGLEPKWKDVTIVRDIIKVKTVRYNIIGEDVGYIRINEFMGDASDTVGKALELFNKKDIKKLIIDLRDNPGGLLDAAVEITDYFLPNDTLIVYTQGRQKEKETRFKAKNSELFKGKIVVLINRGSASASEILAGALQDWDRAILVGEKSFGKGSVQTIIPLSDNSALRMTIAQYMTPKGRKIHGVGIDPDILLEEPVASSFTAGLIEKNYFEEFASDYIKSHPNGLEKDIKKESAKVSESDIKVFFKKTDDEKLVDEFRKMLLNKNEEIKALEFFNDRDIILKILKIEIAKKTKGRDEARKVEIENDIQVKRAIDILNTMRKMTK